MKSDGFKKQSTLDAYQKRVEQLESQLTAEREARQRAEEALGYSKMAADAEAKEVNRLNAYIKASQEQEPVAWLEPYGNRWLLVDMNCPTVGERVALYTQPIIPPEVEELQRENAELTRKLAEQQALSVSILGRLRCYSFDEAESFVTSDGTKELTKLIEEAKRSGTSEDTARMNWIAVHGSFGVDSVSGKVGGNGQKYIAATRKAIDAAILSAAPQPERKD